MSKRVILPGTIVSFANGSYMFNYRGIIGLSGFDGKELNSWHCNPRSLGIVLGFVSSSGYDAGGIDEGFVLDTDGNFGWVQASDLKEAT